MKKIILSFLKLTCIFVVLLNIYIFYGFYLKTENLEYSNLNVLGYNNENLVIYEEEIVDKISEKKVKVQEKTKELIVEKKIEKIVESKNVINSFTGTLTAYGPDCTGCIGITSSGHDLRDGNIYYEDSYFGKTRIVAACTQYPFGTIVRMSNINIYEKPVIAIVLDRGGAIANNKFDLAFETQDDPNVTLLGISKDVTFEILRLGF